MQKLVSFLVLLLFSLPVFALTVDTPLTDITQEKRAEELFHEIRCIVCQSETIADSHAEVAKDIRRSIRQWIIDGLSNETIKTNLSSQYGSVILMKPPLNRSTFLLWLTPWLLLLLGSIAVYIYFRNHRPQKNS